MSNSYLYEFDVNGIPYQVMINQNGASKYVVSFQIDHARLPECHFLRYQDDPYLPSGTGNEVKVLSRIFSSIAGWALKHKPAALTFRGHTPKQFRVYMRVCERTAPKMGYAVKSESQWITLEKIAIDGAADAAGRDLKS